MGAKGKDRRNFEAGIITDELRLIAQIADQFDHIWMGRHCKSCKRKAFCPDYKDLLLR